ncbi:MAG TPA: hypothetical protein VGF48_21455 [Thermoanaerobaculia bacterium]|jgi:hypothetical protein
MQVLLLVLFIAYFYVPYLLFKFFVEESIDLVRRRDITRVEEFFAAAFPSALLNGFTYGLLRFASWFFDLSVPRVDWKVAASVLDPQLVEFRKHISGGPGSEIVYLGALYLGSCVAGHLYGRIELRLLERRAAPVSFLLRGRIQNRIRWIVALAFRRIWLPFFAEAVHPLQPWLVQQVWVFIRTKDDRLYYGRFFEYINSGSGDVDSITLTNVQRYARKTVAECLAAGKRPLTRLSGSFVMKWSEIADINIANPDVMRALRRQYAVRLRAFRAAAKAAAVPPKNTTTFLQRTIRMLTRRDNRS